MIEWTEIHVNWMEKHAPKVWDLVKELGKEEQEPKWILEFNSIYKILLNDEAEINNWY